jgi:myo-inositol-1(or 4)-monophosphatase
MKLETLCQKVVSIALETGHFIKTARAEENLSVEQKGHNDFVTRIDKLSEQKLVGALKDLIPEAGFIVEEESIDKKGEQYNWIIDPIDGTTNFIHGLSPYAISIALADEKEIIMGVIYEIGLNECFYAWKEGGAYLNETPIQVSQASTVADSLIATGFPYSNYECMDAFMESLDYFMKHSHGLRRLGSAATDLAYVACGRFEGFYEYDLKPWDVAAGAIIVKEAGGKVGDFSGGKNYIFGKEIVAANANMYQEFSDSINHIMNA